MLETDDGILFYRDKIWENCSKLGYFLRYKLETSSRVTIFTRDRGRLWIDDHRGLLKTWSRATTSWPLYKRALLFNSSTPYKIRKLLTYKFLSALKKWKTRESVDSNNSIIFPSKFRHLFSSTYQFFLRFQLSFLKLRRVTEFSHRLIFIVTEENNVLFFSFVHLFEWKHCRRFSRRKLYAWYHECCVYPEYTVIRSEKRSKRYFAFNRQKCWDRFIITTIPSPPGRHPFHLQAQISPSHLSCDERGGGFVGGTITMGHKSSYKRILGKNCGRSIVIIRHREIDNKNKNKMICNDFSNIFANLSFLRNNLISFKFPSSIFNSWLSFKKLWQDECFQIFGKIIFRKKRFFAKFLIFFSLLFYSNLIYFYFLLTNLKIYDRIDLLKLLKYNVISRSLTNIWF